MAASHRSCGLKTLPTPVSGIGSMLEIWTGTAARSGVRSRTQASSSPGRNCRAWLQLDVTDRQFAGISVGLADDGGETDGGMLEQDLLDRAGIDVMTATDHEILGAARDPEKAVFVETAEIAGIDPIAVNERALVVLLVEITAEDSGPRHDHDADLVDRAVAFHLALGVELDDANAGEGAGRPTEPSRTGRSGIGHGVHARRFGHAVDFKNRKAELVLDHLADGNGNSRTAAGRIAQARYVGVAGRDRQAPPRARSERSKTFRVCSVRRDPRYS